MKRHQPALLGGLFIGVLSSLPVVNIVNCCCLWVIVGGLLTAYLRQQAQPEPLEAGDAVLSGLLAGVIGAVIVTIGTMIQTAIMGPVVQNSLQQVFENMPQEVSPELRDLIMRITQGNNLVLLSLAINLPLYAVFSMLGSLLGLAFFKKKTPPAAPSA